MFDAGKNEQRHDDASNDVTTPVGFTIVSLRRDFSPVMPLTPSPSEKRSNAPFGHTAVEKRTLPSSEWEVLTSVSPQASRGLDSEIPAHRRPAGSRHLHGAQQPTHRGVHAPAYSHGT